MLLRPIRFAKGTVRFRVVGSSPERLLNLAAQRGVLIWDAHPAPQGLEGCMSAKDYRRIRPLARRASVRTRVLRKRGFPFLAARYRTRTGLAAGAALGAALLVFLSQFIWTIDVTGQEHVSAAQMKTLLAESGVKAGALRKGIDTAQVRRDMLLKVEELSWLSVNIVGCHADVEVKEKIKKPAIDETAAPCNIKARADGVITSVMAAEGVARVMVGSGVRQGDLLISGVTVDKQEQVRTVRARGRVMADVISKKEFHMAKRFDYFSVTENKAARRCLSFLTLRVPCSLSFAHFDDAAYTESDDMLTLNGTVLPLGFVTETAREVQREPVTLDRAGACRMAEKELLLWELFHKGEWTRVSKQLDVIETKDGFSCKATLVFNEDIAQSVDFSVEEQP